MGGYLKYLLVLLILISCTSNIDEEMRLMSANLTGAAAEANRHPVNIILAGQSNAVGRNGDSAPFPSDLPANGEILNATYWTGSDFEDFTLQMNAYPDHIVDWGVEYRLAKYVTDNGDDFRLLKYAQGGSTVVFGEWNADTGTLTSGLITEANQSGIIWDAIVWIQGENDADSQAEADEYEVELTKLINKFRSDINGAVNIPFIIVRLHDFEFTGLDWQDDIKKAQDNIYQDMDNIELVIPPSTIEVSSDKVHYTPLGLDDIAKQIIPIMPVLNKPDREVNVMLCGQSNARGTSKNSTDTFPPEINSDGSRENSEYWDGDSWENYVVNMNCNVSDNSTFNSGVEQAIAERFIRAGYTKVNLIKYCLGGSRIGEGGQWSYPSGNLTVGAINEFNQSGLAKIDHFVWIQGENDSTTSSLANAYEANLTGFINHMESEIPIDNFIIVKLYPFPSYPSGTTPYLDVSQQAQEDVAADMPRQLVRPEQPSTLTDNIHYDLQSLYDLGVRIYNKMYK